MMFKVDHKEKARLDRIDDLKFGLANAYRRQAQAELPQQIFEWENLIIEWTTELQQLECQE